MAKSGRYSASIGVRSGISYLIWKRTHLSREIAFQDEEKEQEDATDFLNWTAEVFIRGMDRIPRDVSNFLTPKQIIVLATFLPDELINLILNNRDYSSYMGILLFADISGFTPLCQKYAKLGHAGAFRLTATLNNYIGAMVDMIYTFGGDLIKFSGDACLASWHVRLNHFMKDLAADAFSCAMHIQHSLGHYMTDIGVLLKVKLALSAGNFTFCKIGDQVSSSYFVFGLPVLEVKKAESFCSSGDTIIGPSAWGLVDPWNYDYEEVHGGFVKLHRIVFFAKKGGIRTTFEFDKKYVIRIDHKIHELRRLTKVYDTGKGRQFRATQPIQCLISRSEELRPFVILPVMHQIDANHSLTNLIEMRQVTIMFINMIAKSKRATEFRTLIDMTYRLIANTVQRKLGIINKVCLFDKDIMFLVIFGLKAFKDKHESARCLQCAYAIRSTAVTFEHLQSISIGVTIGTTYCGVIGHPLRKEYTVIGPAVNKAARLMCTFKDLVSCDLNVVMNSRLPAAYFTPLVPRYLKGIGIVENIFAYEEIRFIPEQIPPILGRGEILRKFRDMLKNRSHYRSLVIMGEPRIGKSRLLFEFSNIAVKSKWKSFYVSVHSTNRYGFNMVQKIVASALGDKIYERTAVLYNAFKADEDRNFLFLLNDIFDVNFPVPTEFPSRLPLVSELFKKALRLTIKKTAVIVDDAQEVDYESWMCFSVLVEVGEAVVVISLADAWHANKPAVRTFLTSSAVLTVSLDKLGLRYLAPLACQMLNINAVPHTLIRILEKHSRGNPGWVQTFILTYLDRGSIVVQKEQRSNLLETVFAIPDQVLLQNRDSRQAMEEDDVNICSITSKGIDENEIPATFDDIIMATFDKFNPFEQLVIKCAAVLGDKFERSVLIVVMMYPPEDTLAAGFISDFPKYAFCNNMRFKFPLFRTTIYEIISLNQRNEFHLRAMKSIEEQIQKCNECINYEILSAINRRKRKRLSPLVDQMQSIGEDEEEGDERELVIGGLGGGGGGGSKWMGMSHRRAPLSPAIMSQMSYPQSSTNISAITGATSHSPSMSPFKVGFSVLDNRETTMGKSVQLNIIKPGRRKSIMVRKESLDLHKETRGFEFGDIIKTLMEHAETRHHKEIQLDEIPVFLPHVLDCNCFNVINSYYDRLIYHARAAEIKIQVVRLLVEYAIHNCQYSQFSTALQLLLGAATLREDCLYAMGEEKGKELSDIADKTRRKKRKKQIKEGFKRLRFEDKRIHTFLAKCYLHLGDYSKASKHLTMVATERYYFNYRLRFSQFLMSKFSAWPEKKKRKIKADMVVTSYIYTTLANLCIGKHDLSEAWHAARVGVQYASAVNNLHFMCSAYSCYIDILLLRGKLRKSKKVEKEALYRCLKIYQNRDKFELFSLGKVVLAVLKGRTYRGELMRVQEVIEPLLNITETFKAFDAQAFIYPNIIKMLTLQKQFLAAYQLLQKIKIEQQGFSRFEFSARVKMYNRVALEIFTETLFAYERPQRLINKIKGYVKPKNSGIDYLVSRRTAMNIWLWHLRRKEFDKAVKWRINTCDEVDLLMEHVQFTLTLWECHLLLMVHKMEEGENVDALVTKLFTLSENVGWIVKTRRPLLLPRYLWLKAYMEIFFSKLKRNYTHFPGEKLLDKAYKIAGKHNNLAERDKIVFAKKVWYCCDEEQFEEYDERYGRLREWDQFQEDEDSSDRVLFHYFLPIPSFIKEKLMNIKSIIELRRLEVSGIYTSIK